MDELQKVVIVRSPKFTAFTARLELATGASTDVDTIKLNTRGELTSLGVIVTGSPPDFFIGIEVDYTIEKAIQQCIRGYLKKSIGLEWFGRLPINTESELLIEWLNATGENINILLSGVIDHE